MILEVVLCIGCFVNYNSEHIVHSMFGIEQQVLGTRYWGILCTRILDFEHKYYVLY